MCKVMEDMRYESAVENAKEIAIRMIKGESGNAAHQWRIPIKTMSVYILEQMSEHIKWSMIYMLCFFALIQGAVAGGTGAGRDQRGKGPPDCKRKIGSYPGFASRANF